MRNPGSSSSASKEAARGGKRAGGRASKAKKPGILRRAWNWVKGKAKAAFG